MKEQVLFQFVSFDLGKAKIVYFTGLVRVTAPFHTLAAWLHRHSASMHFLRRIAPDDGREVHWKRDAPKRKKDCTNLEALDFEGICKFLAQFLGPTDRLSVAIASDCCLHHWNSVSYVISVALVYL